MNLKTPVLIMMLTLNFYPTNAMKALLDKQAAVAHEQKMAGGKEKKDVVEQMKVAEKKRDIEIKIKSVEENIQTLGERIKLSTKEVDPSLRRPPLPPFALVKELEGAEAELKKLKQELEELQ